VPHFDLPLERLREYRPQVRRPDDFDEFWRLTLGESRAAARPPAVEREETGLKLVESYDLTFSGYAGQRIKGWVHVPAGVTAPLPVVVEFHGYSGGRMLGWQNHTYAEAGYAHVVMDSRGQGWRGAVADTPDADPGAGMGTVPGVMTRGIRSAQSYYYRRMMTDAALIVDAARQLPWADPSRVALTGISQGGGLAIAAAGLSEGIAAVATDVPFLCHFERALRITDNDPYSEIVTYLAKYRDRVEETMHTLSYFDGVSLAARANAPAIFSTALRDQTCPPSTVFAAFNAWGHPEKDMTVYPFNAHEGGGEHRMLDRLRFFEERLGE